MHCVKEEFSQLIFSLFIRQEVWKPLLLERWDGIFNRFELRIG
jgi:hypothetical protein